MAVENCGDGWGATIDAPGGIHGGVRGRSVQSWTVELRAGSLGVTSTERVMGRLAEHARLAAPDAAPRYRVTPNGLHMLVTLSANGPEAAADAGEQMFARALESALWPRSAGDVVHETEIRVEPAELYASAA